MRVRVFGKYEGLNNQDYVLRYVGGENDGDVFKTVKPLMTLRVGNSHLAFFARPTMYGDIRTLILVDVPKDLQHLTGRDLHQVVRCERGFVLLNNTTYLWATTADSAERGLVHQFHERNGKCQRNDPILAVINRLQIQGQRVTTAEEINKELPRGGNFCEHLYGKNTAYYYFETDGCVSCFVEARYVTEHEIPNHVGCQLSPERWRVTGGTWVVQWAHRVGNNGRVYKDLVRVVVTKDADRKLVAGKIAEVLK